MKRSQNWDSHDQTHPKAAPDWESIELEYRAGVKTLRQMAAEHGITHGAINKRSKANSWERDLSEKIHQKADVLVSRAAVSTVSTEPKVAEKQIIEAGAQALVTVRLSHRRDIHRRRTILMRLMDEM
ncbi:MULTISPECIES: hypothetical protein [unclassified Variovorax]|uniref:hypothetical protein n=1 Tax=unclassified Variovorax TaxID=663243 RepID=UPI00076CD399|nr:MULTISPECIES: hypothetical protein [unclassified Variovorax]KWT71340.1 hypothetical protein APY03_6534 [Variovorax sp. WDL1]PNG56016.1 hypothetical protein CHC07_02430 [Variovorax sp. B4]PNG57440.1 hypothetical protein CHC06_02433 [Variovorax sp. B2]VTV10185.1 hypothetical protein WDL1CHR_01197 [Variovorax sp. WDL1]